MSGNDYGSCRPAVTLEALAGILGCSVGDVEKTVVGLVRSRALTGDVPPPPLTPRPHPLRWSRRTLGPKAQRAQRRALSDSRIKTHERRAMAWQLRGMHLTIAEIAN